MPNGVAVLDFGSFPGVTDATVAVTGQATIAGGAPVEAWVAPAATVEHTADEHWAEALTVYAGNVVAGTGFTIYGRTYNSTRLYGRWNIGWVWV